MNLRSTVDQMRQAIQNFGEISPKGAGYDSPARKCRESKETPNSPAGTAQVLRRTTQIAGGFRICHRVVPCGTLIVESASRHFRAGPPNDVASRLARGRFLKQLLIGVEPFSLNASVGITQ